MSLLAEIDSWRVRIARIARIGDLDASLLSVEDCARLVEALGRLGNACDAARARLAARVSAAGGYRPFGFADAAEWLASTGGSSAVDAQRALDTAAAVSACPESERAWRAGELSVAQVAEIAKTEQVRPGSEAELLAVARSRPLRVLRELAQHQRVTSIDPDELARRQRRARHFRRWKDDLGMLRFAGALRPADGAAFFGRLDAETERVRRAAHKLGIEESWEAHAADALVGLVEGGARAGRGGRKTDVVMVCDLRAFWRGHPHDGEPCHVIDGGPVPVAEVRGAIAANAFLKAAVHDGVKVHTIKHFGRYLPAELRTALDVGPPPDFDGMRCGDGCGKQHKLQIDHVDPVANGGLTELANLRPRVPREHADKTERDRRAGLLTRRPGSRIDKPP